MGKYTNLEKDVFSVFDSAAWKAENIKTFPTNFIVVKGGNEFIRVSIIPSGTGLNTKSISGILIIDIFIAAGGGPSRAHFIADKLDEYLVGKTLQTGSGSTQFFISALNDRGPDRDNPALNKSVYTIPFTFSGV